MDLYGQSVPQKTVRNMTTKDNPGTLPINLYVTDSPTVQPLDFKVLSEAAAVSVSHRETTETFYKQSQIVAEAAETVEMTETAANEVQHERISRRRKRRFESDFFYYE